VTTYEEYEYFADGQWYKGRRVWACEPPGPIGCGIGFQVTEREDRWDPDAELWVMTIKAWEPRSIPANAAPATRNVREVAQ